MKPIKILHLYPDRMNIYGDFGNIITLQKRMEWRGIKYEYHKHLIDDNLKDDFDIIFIGGGQDKGQTYAAQDLQKHRKIIHDHFNRKVPMLAICGGYQLFGKYFVTSNQEDIPGIGIFNAITKATEFRMIGNIVINSDKFGEMVGFENHSGNTELLAGEKPLGLVTKGFGNNKVSKEEGIFSNNAIGTYLHGSFLPKNPVVADYIIEQAVRLSNSDYRLSRLDDWLENIAARVAQKRPQ